MSYAIRFLESPYASQFAEAFVSAIVALHETVDLQTVEDIVARMNDQQAHVIYLRLARKAAIEGYEGLLDFASAKAEERGSEPAREEDPRAVLYSGIASVTSENVEAVVERLGTIDRGRLSANDRKLLDAAQAVARKVLSQPESGGEPLPPLVEPVAATPDDAGEPMPAVVEMPDVAPDAEAAATPPPAQTEPEQPDLDAGAMKSTDEFLSTTNDKLEAIDRLLKENEG